MKSQITEATMRLEPILKEDEKERLAHIHREPLTSLPAQGNLAAFIDHTLLNPAATPRDIIQLCEEAVNWQTYAVCINSWLVPTAQNILQGSPVKIAAVVGFPLGANASSVKAYESGWVTDQGADEIDMVINRGALKAGAWRLVIDDIRAVREQAPPPVILKVILETAVLTSEEKIIGALCSVAAGADFVKTSTGFDRGGATREDVRLLREVVGRDIGVKAAGGIHRREDAMAMIMAGASRIGASHTQEILQSHNQ
ncbi:deoxyribose-phosphate aldolase [Sulfobacillus thermosulfidooxidans DSM 9293]|uniref:Deoxyribose-phosphate aldolase n=1 Tax=Sulfobacillus thermosulfidooxidans (strain DSM 9293 / VKM B-1269 / AT-1) TaxID=929705 RepID=A0A1W1WCG5_SULTA|nr:deoxyribose-phosphate aldolase [Sulfobacillus thermosulfidooxidans]SMC04001.1 deoxyribose-phosphate aldolase [Sulfobacillus thermosulfidooxidans DSM 9293]